MKIMIMAGGTGGHVFPALATARELQKKQVEIVWMGTRNRIEAKIIANTDIRLRTLTIQGLRSHGLLRMISAPPTVLRAIWQAYVILKQEQPDAVLGMGGFASGPGGIACKLLGKPLIIHEQNAIAGLTNRILAKLTKHRIQAFPGALKDAVTYGNPVRQEIIDIAPPKQRLKIQNRPLKLLILGGSQGAQRLNAIVPESLRQLTDMPEIWHQTGAKNNLATQQFYEKYAIPGKICPFIDDMASAYAWADLIICRAGALTIAELAATGVASILIPYPYAVDDHQTKNGEFLSQHQAAIIIQEKELTATKLAQTIHQYHQDRPRLIRIAERARALAITDSAQQVANLCLTQMRKNNHV